MHRVIVYHTISSREAPLPSDIDVSPERFEDHLRWLAKRPDRVVPLRDLVNVPETAPFFAITFDDGFRDNLTVALPLLEKYGLPMTLFAVPEFIGNEDYLSADELSELADHPLVTIGSHGLSHRHFTKLPPKEAEFELLESKKILADITGRNIDLLAYPFGDCNADVEILAERCGYRAAWSVWNGNNTQYSRWRIPLGRNDSLIRFITKVSPAYFTVKKVLRPPMSGAVTDFAA